MFFVWLIYLALHFYYPTIDSPDFYALARMRCPPPVFHFICLISSYRITSYFFILVLYCIGFNRFNLEGLILHLVGT